MMSNPMIKWGLYYGGASILLTALYYFVSRSMLFGSGLSIVIGIALAIFCLVMAMKEKRHIGEGFLGFGEGLAVGMGAFVLGTLLSSLFQWVLFNFVDTGLIQESIDYTIEASRKVTDMFTGMSGLSEEQAEEMIAQTEEQLAEMGNPMSLPKILQGWIMSSIIFGLPLSLILAAILKKS